MKIHQKFTNGIVYMNNEIEVLSSEKTIPENKLKCIKLKLSVKIDEINICFFSALNKHHHPIILYSF